MNKSTFVANIALSSPAKIRVTGRRGRVTVTSAAEDTILLKGCYASILLSDDAQLTTRSSAAQVSNSKNGLINTLPGTTSSPELRWYIEPEGERALTMRLEIENTTRQTLSIERMDVLVAPTGYRQVGANRLKVAQAGGWQSWSNTTAPAPLKDVPAQSPPPVYTPNTTPGGEQEGQTRFSWATRIETPGDNSLLAGFITARRQEGVLALQPGVRGHHFWASNYTEGIPLPPGATLQSETLLLIFDAPQWDAWREYAGLLAREMEARPWPSVPTGWCSWYYYYTGVTGDDVLLNLAQLSRERKRIPIEYVQIDDGYQTQIGDWLTINFKFPRGMRHLANTISEAGYKPGIWLAPFLVSEHSDIYKAHPDWVVRGDDGQPIVASPNWNSRNYALDTTHPAALDWLRHVISTMVNEWRYNYLKIDFLYAAALRGRRHDPNITGIEAYRRGLELIREVAGERLVLGCGAPLAPSVGLVDAMRIGADVAPYWGHTSDPYRCEPSLSNAIRATLNRAWMHGSLWVNDPDCVLVREHDSTLTIHEVEAWLSIVALTGGMVLLSDSMAQLEPERAALIPLLLPPNGETAIPSGPVVDGMPSQLALKIVRPWESWLVVGLYNWHSKAQPAQFDPAEWGIMAGESYHLYDLFVGVHTGPYSGTASLDAIAPHGVRLLAVHSDLGRPQVIGSTLHLLGGVVEIEDEKWQDDLLIISLNCPGERKGELMVYVPEGYRLLSVAGDHTILEQSANCVLISVTVRVSHTISLRFARQYDHFLYLHSN